jgi:hypothetical protein
VGARREIVRFAANAGLDAGDGAFFSGAILHQSEGYARHLFGNFYEVYVPLEAMDGSDDEY